MGNTRSGQKEGELAQAVRRWLARAGEGMGDSEHLIQRCAVGASRPSPIQGTQFKGRGLDRLVLQVGVLVFVVAFAVAYYGAFRNRDALMLLRWLRRMILWSLVVPTGFAFLEIFRLVTHRPEPAELLRLISELVHRRTEYVERVRSVSGEASWFGIWLAFVLPWLISDAIRLRPVGLGGFVVAAVAAAFMFSRFTWVVTGLACGGFTASRWVLGGFAHSPGSRWR